MGSRPCRRSAAATGKAAAGHTPGMVSRIRARAPFAALALAACSSGMIGGSSPGAGGAAGGMTGGAGTSGAAGMGGSGISGTTGVGAAGSSGAAGMTGSGAGTAGTTGWGNTSGGAGTTGAAGVSGAAGSPATGAIADRLTTSDVTVPAGVKAGVRNYRIWGASMLKVAPLYTAPLANCGTLLCYTSGTSSAYNARAIRLDASDKLTGAIDLGAGLECRGIAAEPDGHFAALLWDNATDKIYVRRFDIAGAQAWSTELTNSDNHPTDFGIGESRLEFGGDKYGAYYHVHSDSGHEGDTLKFTAASTGAQTTQWSWGCSHSMSDLLSYHPQANSFLPVCVTDCYPGTGSGDFATVAIGGVYTDNKNKVMSVDAGCNGSVAGELGGAAIAPVGWKVTFNAHQAPATMGDKSYSTATMNQDIAFAAIDAGHKLTGAVVWLTTTPANEADSALARWQPDGDATEQYLVGWMEPATPAAYKLARVGAAGNFLEGPTDVAARAKWGQRDDPLRVHTNHDVVWGWFDAANATTLHFARLRSGGTAQCASF